MELWQPFCENEVTKSMGRAWVFGDIAESPINPRTSCYITNKHLKN